MALKTTFVECASPEAISAELAKARATMRRWERKCRELEHLYIDRQMQIRRGEWPLTGDTTKEN